MTPSITESTIFTALRTFLLGILPVGIEVVQAQQNNVGEPVGPDFVSVNSIGTQRLSTNVETYTDPGTNPGTKNSTVSMQFRVQLDVHGPNAADNATTIVTLFRDDYGCEQFATVNPGIQPLFCEDPRQMPFINGENQYEQRWMIEAFIEYNPVIQTPQDFASQVDVNVVSVEATYPP
ncbi:hypothetical protein [Pandoraea sp.]|uniref:phage neck terminator protein n=1 Tax=Pandoraea sp. TaxID=1883445 RepID=UPI0025DE12AB|nr:hypothetical protein [Pandoraea sp.]